MRDRLERLARRLGFRCTDILVWDTGHVVVNAGVTGALPWFRYVLLTDALVDCLDDHEIAAVFGHEIGHIAHRHLLYFGFFFLGSLGVTGAGRLGDRRIAARGGLRRAFAGRSRPSTVRSLQGVARWRMRRGSTSWWSSASCRGGSSVRPTSSAAAPSRAAGATARPTLDLDGAARRRAGRAAALCPVGIRIFANALANVAALNGMEHGRRSWRHGSIARRIAFLEGLEGKPDAERGSSAASRGSGWSLALGLIAAVLGRLDRSTPAPQPPRIREARTSASHARLRSARLRPTGARDLRKTRREVPLSASGGCGIVRDRLFRTRTSERVRPATRRSSPCPSGPSASS